MNSGRPCSAGAAQAHVGVVHVGEVRVGPRGLHEAVALGEHAQRLVAEVVGRQALHAHRRVGPRAQRAVAAQQLHRGAQEPEVHELHEDRDAARRALLHQREPEAHEVEDVHHVGPRAVQPLAEELAHEDVVVVVQGVVGREALEEDEARHGHVVHGLVVDAQGHVGLGVGLMGEDAHVVALAPHDEGHAVRVDLRARVEAGRVLVDHEGDLHARAPAPGASPGPPVRTRS